MHGRCRDRVTRSAGGPHHRPVLAAGRGRASTSPASTRSSRASPWRTATWAPEARSAEGTRLSAPATYVAGVFDVAPHPNGIPELVLAPDWTRLKIMVEGNELTLEAGEAQEHRRVLDLRQGMLWRDGATATRTGA